MREKILVIEDDDHVRDNLKILLEAENYKVCLAKNGKEGIKKTINEKPDLVLCDIIMPDLDGYTVLNIINNSNLYFPFIFLTAKNEHTDLRKGMVLGADDYITKPYDSDELLNAIKIRLKKFDQIKTSLTKYNNSVNNIANKKIFVRTRNYTVAIPLNNILYISAERQYSIIHTIKDQRFTIKKSLNKWENELSDNLFIRIHRSTLLNKTYIKEVRKNSENSYVIHLNNCKTTLEVSRRFYKKLRLTLSVI